MARRQMLTLVARGSGWRWPLRALEVWDERDQIAEFPAELVLMIVQHYLQGAALQTRVREQRDPPPPVPEAPSFPATAPRKPLRAVNGRRLRGR